MATWTRNYTEPDGRPLTLPLDYAAIERILPHRYPFLLVDRITELEPDKRIVGIKNVSFSERYLSPERHGERVGVAADDSDRSDRPGRRDPDPVESPRTAIGCRSSWASSACAIAARCYPGDVVVIEAKVKRLRSRMGVLTGHARVDGRVVVHGEMTFALGSRPRPDPLCSVNPCPRPLKDSPSRRCHAVNSSPSTVFAHGAPHLIQLRIQLVDRREDERLDRLGLDRRAVIAAAVVRHRPGARSGRADRRGTLRSPLTVSRTMIKPEPDVTNQVAVAAVGCAARARRSAPEASRCREGSRPANTRSSLAS